MSYDIYFKVKVEGLDKYISVCDDVANTTWNLRDMITNSTGLEWKNEENNGYCRDVIPYIEKGYYELTKHPSKYRKYESPNGWGTIDGCINFFLNIIHAWGDLKEDDQDLAYIATFWIE